MSHQSYTVSYNVHKVSNHQITWYLVPIYQLTTDQLQYIIPFLAHLFYNNKHEFLQYINYNPNVFDSIDTCTTHVTSLLQRVQCRHNYILFNTDLNNVQSDATAQCIGVVGIKDDIDSLSATQHTVECGYLLDKQYTGHGIVTITLLYSIQQCMQYCSQIDTIELHTNKYNIKSLHIGQRLGFALDIEASQIVTEQQTQDIEVYKLHRYETEPTSNINTSRAQAAKPTITHQLIDMNAVRLSGYTDSMFTEYIERLSYREPVKYTLHGTYVINQQIRHVMYKIFNTWAQRQGNTELNTLLLIQQHSHDTTPKQCNIKLYQQLIAAKCETEPLNNPQSTPDLIQQLFAGNTVIITEYIGGVPLDNSKLIKLSDTDKDRIRIELTQLTAQLAVWKLFYTDINENNIIIDSDNHAHLVNYDHVYDNIAHYGYETIQINRLYVHVHQQEKLDYVVYEQVQPNTGHLMRNTMYQVLMLRGKSTDNIQEAYDMIP